MLMSTVVEEEGKLSELLAVARTGSVIFMGETPHKSWGVDLSGKIFIVENDSGNILGFDEDGVLIPRVGVRVEFGQEFSRKGQHPMRRGMKFYFTHGGAEVKPLGLHECDSWKICEHGIAYVSGDKFYILIIKEGNEE